MRITKAKDTVSVDYQGILFEVADMENDAYIGKLLKLSKAQRKAGIDVDSLPYEESVPMQAKAMAGTVLVGWDAAAMGAAMEPPVDCFDFSPQAAEELLLDDRHLRNFIRSVATDKARYVIESQEAAMGK